MDYLQIDEKIKSIEKKIESVFGHSLDTQTIDEDDFMKMHEFLQKVNIVGIPMSEDLLANTYSDLTYILGRVGENNQEYKRISNTLVNSVATLINAPILQNAGLSLASDLDPAQKRQLRADNAKAISLINRFEIFYMDQETKQFIGEIKNRITGIERRVSPKANCYIATIIYKDYNCRSVSILREYRDKNLMTSMIGRLCVNLYYLSAPFFGTLVRRSSVLQSIGKKILDKKIKKVKKGILK